MIRSIKTFFLILALLESPGAIAFSDQKPLELAQMTPLSFNAWRPYKNPAHLVQVGMNKGQALADRKSVV